MNKFLLGLLLLPATAIAQQDSITLHQSNTTIEATKKIVVYKQPNIWAQSTNFSNALSIAQTGVQTFSSGAPGSDIEMIIRGSANPYGNSSPMIMIDGMPFYGDKSAINTYNIESISVEKIPANFSAPLSLTTNGIIHIRTAKSATRPSKWYVNLNANMGFSSRAIPQYDIITDPGQYYETYWQMLRRTVVGGTTPEQAASENLIPALYGHNLYNVPDAELIDPTTGKLNPNAQLKYKDSWKDALTRSGLLRQYNVSARKTWKKADVFISGNYAKDDGYMIKSSFERMGANLQAHYRPVKGLEIGLSGLYSYSKDQQLTYGTAYINPIFALYNTAPVHPLYQRDADGNILIDPTTGKKQYSDYPYNIKIIPALDRFKNTQRYRNLFLIPSIKYEIVQGLNVAVQASYMKRAKLYTSIPDDTCVLTDNFIFQPEISYNTQWHKHQLSVKAQYFNMKASLDRRNEIVGRYRISELLQDSFQSVLGDVAYDFNNKLKVQAKLQKQLKVTANPYIQDNDWSWATLANWKQKVSTLNTEFSAGYSSSVIQYNLFNPIATEPYYSVQSNGMNPIQKQIDLGVKISGNRVEANLNWFQKSGRNIYLVQYFPPTVGGSYLSQGLDTRTRVLEVNINTRLTNSGSAISWNLGLHATHWNTRVTAVPGNDTIYTYRGLITKGANPNEWYAPEYAGIDPRTGAALYYKYTNGQKTTTSDINSLLKSDYQSQGSNLPTVFGSLYNRITFRNFSLQFAISYALGGTAYDAYYSSLMGGYGNYHKDALNAWNPDNRTSTIPALDINYNYDKYSSRFTTSASWASLKYVTLNYRLPFKLYKKSGFDNMSVYASGENLFFISARKGFNPNEAIGTPMYSYQPMRTVRLGVNIDL
ncbi:SusC/RagA family TonB-linked outer membrane protein [Edaphocola flava]|uniref:TonB-dependent receptor plug domain-containing protein n=1 Tax=Edaphocola flava TaxID=2499629 RepID=UPI00100A3052|nr:TonB-dependent receptor plug domain-containing protein [Edaphocola flava]